MAGFSERLSAMKGKQEASEQMKKEQAAEAARLEREAKRSELSAERDTVIAEFAQAEQTANEAREAIAQADAFAEQQGENLDPEAKAEIDAIKVEAGEAQQKFEELKTRLDGLNTEISAFEESSESQETSAEATTEVSQGEEPATEENPQVEVEQTPDATVEKSAEVSQPEVVTENQEPVGAQKVAPEVMEKIQDEANEENKNRTEEKNKQEKLEQIRRREIDAKNLIEQASKELEDEGKRVWQKIDYSDTLEKGFTRSLKENQSDLMKAVNESKTLVESIKSSLPEKSELRAGIDEDVKGSKNAEELIQKLSARRKSLGLFKRKEKEVIDRLMERSGNIFHFVNEAKQKVGEDDKNLKEKVYETRNGVKEEYQAFIKKISGFDERVNSLTSYKLNDNDEFFQSSYEGRGIQMSAGRLSSTLMDRFGNKKNNITWL